MKELFEFSFSLINIIPTVFLLLVVVYWIVVFIGMIDISSIDIDLDLDADADLDVDVDTDVDIDLDADVDTDVSISSGGHGFGIQVLTFFNIGKLPLMILLSFAAVSLWLITVYVNYYFNVSSVFISLLLLIPEFFLSLFIAKIITTPIAKLFAKVEADTGKPEDFRGKVAVVRFSLDEKTDGQIELRHRGATIILHARSVEGKIDAGTEILIIDYIEENKYYLVEPFKL